MHTTFFSPFTNANSSLITTPPPPSCRLVAMDGQKRTEMALHEQTVHVCARPEP